MSSPLSNLYETLFFYMIHGDPKRTKMYAQGWQEVELVRCVKCQMEDVAAKRVEAGYITCLTCGEADARRVRFTVAPAYHKGPDTVHRDKTMLRYINRPGRGTDY